MCLADSETYLQADTTVNITNSSECDVIINEGDVDFDDTLNSWYYYLPGVGSIYFDSQYIGAPEPAPSPEPSPAPNDDDNCDDDQTRGNDNDHNNGKYDNDQNNGKSDNDHNNGKYDDGHRHSRRHYRSSSTYGGKYNDGHHTYTNDDDHIHKDNDHSRNDDDHTNNNSGNPSPANNNYQDWDNWVISPLVFTIGNTTFCVNKTGQTYFFNYSSPAPETTPEPSPEPANYYQPGNTIIVINVTAGDNGSSVFVNVTTNTSTSSDVIGAPISVTITALQNDQNNQFQDQWGNDARHVQIRDNMINSKTQFESQLDSSIQQQGINAQRQTDVDISARQNIIIVETTYLFPQGATEDDKNKTCNALANTAESYSDLTYDRNCDISQLSHTKRQTGDYLMFTTYSMNSDESSSGVVFSLSIFAFLIVFLTTCNL